MTNTKSVFRYEIPIDDQQYQLQLGKIVHVGMKNPNQRHLDVWAETDIYLPSESYQVFGTGHDIPKDLQHVGSVIDSRDLVWHLYRTFTW